MSEISENHSLKDYNTFGIDCSARFFLKVTDNEELVNGLRWAEQEKTELLVLGGGSNILLTKDYEGLVVLNEILGKEIIEQNDESVILKIGAGEVWHDLVIYCVENGFGGIENLSLIPGTVGAAPMQNIGAYGVEIKEVFESLTALNRETLELVTFTKEDCMFGYRQSVFKRELKELFVITSVTLKLEKNRQVNTSYGAIQEVLSANHIDRPTIKDVSDAVIQIRQSKLPDPKEIGNSGSFFKNPVIEQAHFEKILSDFPSVPSYPNGDFVKVPAGWLIEQCGWKGKRVGNIGVHDKQALVLVNHGGGQGKDIWALAQDIQHSVKERFDIDLEPEVNVI